MTGNLEPGSPLDQAGPVLVALLALAVLLAAAPAIRRRADRMFDRGEPIGCGMAQLVGALLALAALVALVWWAA